MHKTDTLSDSYYENILRNLRNVLYTSEIPKKPMVVVDIYLMTYTMGKNTA